MCKKFKKTVKSVAETFRKTRITTVSGAWVFYFILAVVPLSFLLFTAFNLFGVNISGAWISALPLELKEIASAIDTASKNVSKGITVFFAITVILSSSALLNQMSKDGDFIYGVRGKRKRGFLRRVWAIVCIAVLFSVFLGSALLFSFKDAFFSSEYLKPLEKISVSCFVFSLIIVASFIVNLILNVFISPVNLSFKELAIGSVVSLSVIVLGTIGFLFYVKFFSTYNVFYGALSAVIVFLLWAYIIMIGIFSGAVVSMKMYFFRCLPKKTPLNRR